MADNKKKTNQQLKNALEKFIKKLDQSVINQSAEAPKLKPVVERLKQSKKNNSCGKLRGKK